MRTVGPVIRRRNEEARGALIGYLPVGFPTLDESVEAAVALVENGVDVLELGLPYSDPVMDGPVIQAATQQALANGFRLADGFEAVRRITERTDAPVLIMTYWNPVVQYGVDRFADDLARRRGSGPHHARPHPRRGGRLDRRIRAHRPRSRVPRRADIDRRAHPPGGRREPRVRLRRLDDGHHRGAQRRRPGGAHARRTARATPEPLPAASGSASRPPTQVAEVLEYADGAIVGSALVKALADGGVAAAGELAAELARGTRSE